MADLGYGEVLPEGPGEYRRVTMARAKPPSSDWASLANSMYNMANDPEWLARYAASLQSYRGPPLGPYSPGLCSTRATPATQFLEFFVGRMI